MARAAAPTMIRAGWGRIVNISMNHETMRRRGFSPYGPSKAAPELATIIRSQDLAGMGVTSTRSAGRRRRLDLLIPAGRPGEFAAKLLDPAIVAPPLLCRRSATPHAFNGRRLVANSPWGADLGGAEAAAAASEEAGWP